MKHLRNIPICANTLFIYKLDIKEDLTLKFTKEKFKSTRGGSSLISEDLHILKKYKELNKEINKAIDATIEEILMLKNINYRIFTSWLTRAKPEDFSASHLHTNSWLSGVYYPKGDSGFSIKFFNDSRTQFSTSPIKYNIFNSREWTIIPEDNLLILFFSQLRHKIMPNQSKKDRFSLAFNLLPKGEFGTTDSKTIF
jgi:uncharacterized protein (TIGR02466 family)|tara:strand:- start:337 stop:927 length:591 start_codon:yes stop_codon:yes gene_type:complete